MRRAIKRRNKSAVVVIPTAVMNAAQLDIGSSVDIYEENGRIVIKPASSKYNLEELLAGITEENLPQEVSFGPATGKEIF